MTDDHSSPQLTAFDFSREVEQLTEQFTGREWLFEEIDAWVRSGEQRFFLLTGQPGIGKSAIAARLLQLRDDIVAHHFCVAGRNSTITPGTVLRSLAAQLGQALPNYGLALANTINPEFLSVELNIDVRSMTGGQITGVVIKNLVAPESQDALEILLRAPLDAMEPPEQQPLLILIDSLDEAVTYRGGGNLVRLLAGADDLPDWLRIICTSRRERSVLRYFDAIPTWQLAADSELNQRDVHDYIKERISRRPLATQLAGVPKITAGAFAVQVAELANGNFLYTRVLLDDVEAGRQPLDDLAALPTSLDEIYHDFLTRFTVEEWETRYHPLFSVLAVGAEPLTEHQLTYFTGLRRTKVRQTLNVARQFLDTTWDEERRECFSLFHQSLRDYLVDEERNRDFWCAPEDGHQDVATYYLQQHRADWSTCDQYGLRYLPLHLQQSGQTETLQKMLMDYGWLRARLEAADVTALIADYDLLSDNGVPHLVQAAIQMSARVLAADKTQLVGQLLGRLLQLDYSDIRALLKQAQHSPDATNLYPLTASLASPRHTGNQAFAGHEDEVNSLVGTRDGRYAVSGGKDGGIRIWDLEDGTLLRAMKDDANGVADLAVTADGRYVVSASDAGLRVWDLDSGSLVRMIGETDSRRRHSTAYIAPISAVRVTPDRRLMISASGSTLRVWNFETGALLHTLKGHEREITLLALTADGSKAISGCRQWNAEVSVTNDPHDKLATMNAIKVWDLASGQLLHRLRGPLCGTNAVAVSADDRFVVSVPNTGLYLFGDGSIRVWNIESGEMIRTMGTGGHTFTITSVAITPDNRLVLSGGGNCFQRYSPEFTLKLWDFETGKLEHTFDVHTGPVVAINVTADGRRAVSAGGRCVRPGPGPEDFSIRVWDLDRRELVATFQGEDSITCLSIPNQDTIVAGSRNGAVHILRLRVR